MNSLPKYRKKSATTSLNDAKAGQRNRVELCYLNLKLKQLEKQRNHIYYLHSRSIEKIQKDFYKIKEHTGLYEDQESQRSSSKDYVEIKSENSSLENSNSQFSGKITPVYENYELISRKPSSNPYYTGVHPKNAASSPEKNYLESSRVSSHHRTPNRILIEVDLLPISRFQSSGKVQGILKNNNSPGQPISSNKKTTAQITFKSTENLQEKSEKLKEQDPIFRRRSQQLQLFKLQGKAPKYETLDITLLHKKISKNYIEKRKKELIEEASKTVGNKNLIGQRHNPYDYSNQHKLRSQIEFFVKNYQLIT